MGTETISDILREMRRRGNAEYTRIVPDGYGGYESQTTTNSYLIELASRIKAAHKRESVDEIDKIKEAGRDLQRLSEVGVSKKETTTMGNAAKMREALMKVSELIHDEAKWADEMSNQQAIALGIVQSALAAPPRNCDLPTVIAAPHGAWLKDRDNWDEFGNPEKEIYEWLFAEAKGEHNESK